MTAAATPVLQGSIAALSFVAALFFLRFWLSSGDRLFAFFAASFFIESLNRLLIGFNIPTGDDSALSYGIRLLSYALILVAIWDKNRPGRLP